MEIMKKGKIVANKSKINPANFRPVKNYIYIGI